MVPITQVAELLGLSADDLVPYGRDKAKVHLEVLQRPRSRSAANRLILVDGDWNPAVDQVRFFVLLAACTAHPSWWRLSKQWLGCGGMGKPRTCLFTAF